MSYTYDVFISHASEDKADFVEPLVTALEERGVKPWYDGQQIELGDDFRRKMDNGLRSSRFGVVVLSPSFAKYWTEAELSALFQQEHAFDEKRILPVVHLLTPQQVATQWPLLSARAAATAADGPVEVARRIADVVQKATTPRVTNRSQLFGVPQTWGGDFVGRDQALKQLTKMLRRATSVRVAPSLEGMAGIGKTDPLFCRLFCPGSGLARGGPGLGPRELRRRPPEVARSRLNLATVLQALGDLAGAQELLKETLESDFENLGEDQPSVARSRSNLALVLKDLGELAGARDLLEQALESDLQNLGEDHLKVAIRRSKLAWVLKGLGDHERAKAEAAQALDIVSRQPEGSWVRVRVEPAARGILGGDG